MPSEETDEPEKPAEEPGGEQGSKKESGGNKIDPSKPDAPGNDKPPPPGSAAERFEKYCDANPKRCFD